MVLVIIIYVVGFVVGGLATSVLVQREYDEFINDPFMLISAGLLILLLGLVWPLTLAGYGLLKIGKIINKKAP